MMRRMVLQMCLTGLLIMGATGCAYTVPLTPIEADAIPALHDTKVPGQFSALIATEDCCKKEVRSELLMCQAPTYYVNGQQAVEASLRTALPAVFEDVVVGQSNRVNGLTFTVERFDVSVRFDPLGVVPMVHATADVGVAVEAQHNGQIVMKGHAYAQQANVGRVVLFCAEASSTIAEAVNTATREALSKLAELLANSATIRNMAGPSPNKQAQVQ